jgi:hypothetical protein
VCSAILIAFSPLLIIKTAGLAVSSVSSNALFQNTGQTASSAVGKPIVVLVRGHHDHYIFIIS